MLERENCSTLNPTVGVISRTAFCFGLRCWMTVDLPGYPARHTKPCTWAWRSRWRRASAAKSPSICPTCRRTYRRTRRSHPALCALCFNLFCWSLTRRCTAASFQRWTPQSNVRKGWSKVELWTLTNLALEALEPFHNREALEPMTSLRPQDSKDETSH